VYTRQQSQQFRADKYERSLELKPIDIDDGDTSEKKKTFRN